MKHNLPLTIALLLTGCASSNKHPLLREYISSEKNAPVVILLGKTAGRMDEVASLIRDMGDLSVIGTFTEAEAMQRIKTTENVRLVALGGAVDDAARQRIRAHLEKHMPKVPTSEPGIQYPYSDDNIRQDIQRKLALPVKSQRSHDEH